MDPDPARPKHVEFYTKNKFEKLVHLVGFVVRLRVYHDALSSECQNDLYFSPQCHYPYY